MSELDKLQEYLELNDYVFERVDTEPSEWFKEAMMGSPLLDKGAGECHQIVVFDSEGKIAWDAICHYGSYGFDRGLLEVMGESITKGDNVVEGWLTAQDIIDRLEA